MGGQRYDPDGGAPVLAWEARFLFGRGAARQRAPARRHGFDWDNAVEATFPNLKPSTTSISIRLPVPMLEELKALANERDVPYQSLMKVYLAERVARERLRKVPV